MLILFLLCVSVLKNILNLLWTWTAFICDSCVLQLYTKTCSKAFIKTLSITIYFLSKCLTGLLNTPLDFPIWSSLGCYSLMSFFSMRIPFNRKQMLDTLKIWETFSIFLYTEEEAATGAVLQEKVFLKTWQNLQKNICVGVPFLIKLQALGL